MSQRNRRAQSKSSQDLALERARALLSRWNRTRLQLEVLEDRICPSVRVWTGLGADANWSTAANWAGNVAPQADDNLVFPAGASQATNTNNFAAGTRFRSLTIQGGAY